MAVKYAEREFSWMLLRIADFGLWCISPLKVGYPV